MASYSTRATTSGGRNGRAILENNALALAMALPKDLGGSGEGHNPEQLFALGWSACFGQAILVLAKKHGLDGQAAKVTCEVTLNVDNGSFSLAADLKVALPGADKAKLQALIEDAHSICPYSKATRNNVAVKLTAL
jgi:Ohr subfamily peroxiredoxin